MIEIISPARFVERDTLSLAVGRATQAWVTVAISPGCHLRDGPFAGSDANRADDFTRAWNAGNNTLWCARGGYGAGRILPLLHGRLASRSNTLIGYSDQTYLLAHIAKHRLGKAVHGPMPVDLLMPEKQDAVDALLVRIGHNDFSFRWKSGEAETVLREGEATGHTIIGNLSVLTRLIGTRDEPAWDGAVLFIEDVDEYLYAIDRMFLHLAESGVLGRIVALVLGSFTGIKDNDPPFGATVAQMALHHLRGRTIPVVANAPFGHGAQNQPIVFSARCTVLCSAGTARIEAEG